MTFSDVNRFRFIARPGGIQKMNFSTLEGMFRIIQSIPGKKAEPIKRWLAVVGAERINQMQDPEKVSNEQLRIIGDLAALNNGLTRESKQLKFARN